MDARSTRKHISPLTASSGLLFAPRSKAPLHGNASFFQQTIHCPTPTQNYAYLTYNFYYPPPPKATEIQLLGCKISNTLYLQFSSKNLPHLFYSHMENNYAAHTIFRYIELEENLILPPCPVFFLMEDVIIEINSENSQHSPISSAVRVFFFCWLHANYCTGGIISHSHLEFTAQ